MKLKFPFQKSLGAASARRTTIPVFALSFLVLGSTLYGSTAPPTPLLIDFQNIGASSPIGYQTYEASNQVLSTLGPRNYVSPVPATIEITTVNLPDGQSDFRVVNRGSSFSSEITDWIGVDARLGPPGSSTAGNPRPTMNVIVSNLADGIYAWSSRHHDPLNQTGVVTYAFSHAGGSSSGTIDISAGTEPITRFNTEFHSAGGMPVTLSMTVTEPAGTSRFAVTASFALINTLQITPVPEPHVMTLVVFGAAIAGSWRSRRSD
jgi:hypothetical protein